MNIYQRILGGSACRCKSVKSKGAHFAYGLKYGDSIEYIAMEIPDIKLATVQIATISTPSQMIQVIETIRCVLIFVHT